jgi:hypothetical protein
MVETMTQFGTWVSYGGSAKIALAVVLMGVAGGLAYAGARLKHPVQVARPRQPAMAAMLSAWGISIIAFLVCLSIFVQRIIEQYPGRRAAADPILPVTLLAVVATFVVIFKTGPQDSRASVASSVVGAIAAPMIFELPFDLIVMSRIYPPVRPDPAFYRALFFVPLLLVEITTLSLLALSPRVKLSRGTFFSFAAMLVVFAGWSLDGFAYPSAPIPTALNVLSKLLAFVTLLSLFLPQRSPATPRDARPAVTALRT